MKVRTKLQAGGTSGTNWNHNEKLVAGLRVRSAVKAGQLIDNHNEKLVRGLRVRSSVKAGADRLIDRLIDNHNETLSRSA